MAESRPFFGPQSNQGTRRYRGSPRPVPGNPRPDKPNIAQGHLSLADTLVRKQEHVLRERSEIGLVCHSDSCKKNGRRAGGNVIDFVSLMEQCSAYAAAKRIDEMFPATSNHEAKRAPATDAGATGAHLKRRIRLSLATTNLSRSSLRM